MSANVDTRYSQKPILKNPQEKPPNFNNFLNVTSKRLDVIAKRFDSMETNPLRFNDKMLNDLTEMRSECKKIKIETKLDNKTLRRNQYQTIPSSIKRLADVIKFNNFGLITTALFIASGSAIECNSQLPNSILSEPNSTTSFSKSVILPFGDSTWSKSINILGSSNNPFFKIHH